MGELAKTGWDWTLRNWVVCLIFHFLNFFYNLESLWFLCLISCKPVSFVLLDLLLYGFCIMMCMCDIIVTHYALLSSFDPKVRASGLGRSLRESGLERSQATNCIYTAIFCIDTSTHSDRKWKIRWNLFKKTIFQNVLAFIDLS